MPDRRRRVLHVVKGLGPGGAERLLHAAAAERDQDSFAYDVAYVLPWKNHGVHDLVATGVDVHCLGAGAGRTRPLLDPRWVTRLRTLCRAKQYDVVHVHSPLVAGVVRPMVRGLGPRRPALISTEHNGWDTYAVPTRILTKLTYRLDDAHVAVSNEVRASVAPRLRDNVEVVLHGVRLDAVRAWQAERAAVRAELGFGDDDVVVGTVANYLPQKAYPDLFAAARIALDADPRLRFVAIGQGPLEAEVQAEYARRGLDDRFSLLGYRSDAVRVLASCDIFTLASHFEGFPVALMEALALGLPVVVTAVGGIPDAVTDGREGMLVPPGRPNQLADSVLTLTADAQRRARMGDAARELSEDFDIRRAVRRIEAIYAELADTTTRFSKYSRYSRVR